MTLTFSAFYPIRRSLLIVVLMLSPWRVHAATVLRNCFAAPGDYQVSLIHDLVASNNSAGTVFTPSGHLVGNGAAINAQCDCPGTMSASTTVMGYVFASTSLSAGVPGYGHLTDKIDIDIDAYTNAINSPDGGGLFQIALNNYPSTSPVSKSEAITSNESTETVCSPTTQPVVGVAVRQFKWNVIAARLYIKVPILGQETIPSTLVVQSSACLYYGSGMCVYGDAQPVANVWLSGALSAPLSCTINAGSVIEVDFGSLVSTHFRAQGRPPDGFTLKNVDISFHCDDAAVSNYDKIKLTLTADQGVSDPGEGLIAKMLGRDDIGVRMYDTNTNNIRLDGSMDFPIILDASGNGIIKFQAAPVATSGNKPTPGKFEGNVTVKMDIR